ncbi:hypothetical protein B0H11DRAFT_1174042 [Mycena galericulata]|nr:hypothetical protein B0H11DRAFT_1174042 [Mycena galericulata]
MPFRLGPWRWLLKRLRSASICLVSNLQPLLTGIQPTTFNLAAATSLANYISVSSAFPTSSSSTSSPTSTATTTSSQPGTSTAASATQPSSASTAVPITAASSKSRSQVGPIVGGIIGGVLLLALVGVAIWFMKVRRRRRHIAPSAAYLAALRAGSPMPYQAVHHESPKNSTEELRSDRPESPWVPVSIQSNSRFLEHT